MNQDLPAVSKFMSAVALALGMMATLSACSPRRDTVPDSKTERFRLSASPGTADGYPATIDEARFTTSGGGSYALHRPKVDRAADVRESRAQASPQAQQEIATGTLSAKRWDDYLKTYPRKLAFSQPLTLTGFGVGYVDAERVGAGLTDDRVAYAKVMTEPMAAFQALQARFPQEVITLLVDTDEALMKASLSLNAGGQSIPLAKSRVQPFDLD